MRRGNARMPLDSERAEFLKTRLYFAAHQSDVCVHTRTELLGIKGVIGMNTLRFGIEIETIGQTRGVVACAIQSVVGGEVRHVGTPFCYDPWKVIDRRGRTWQVMADASLNARKDYQAEIVGSLRCARSHQPGQDLPQARGAHPARTRRPPQSTQQLLQEH
jgi:hypothetical protein